MITFPPVSLLDWLIFLVVAAGSLMVLISVLKFIWRPAPSHRFSKSRSLAPSNYQL
ncbi:hypothetical protein [Oceanisphaera avium]|uniref:hypothetical protein n=1 Tax=Oceanisphaera avium TaxID=1903694 RepID=UPI0018DFBFDA|nr:hypothetical protein [Oceanisphaera avium]